MDAVATPKRFKRPDGPQRIAQFRAQIEREYEKETPDLAFIARAEFTISKIEDGLKRKARKENPQLTTAEYMERVVKMLIPLVPKHTVSQVLEAAKLNPTQKGNPHVSPQAQSRYHQKPSALQEGSRSAGGPRAFCRTAQA